MGNLRFSVRSDTKQCMDEKDDIITELRQQIRMLLKRIQQLEEEVTRLKKDSHNSS
jgi:ribosomal protein S15P/S13E